MDEKQNTEQKAETGVEAAKAAQRAAGRAARKALPPALRAAKSKALCERLEAALAPFLPDARPAPADGASPSAVGQGGRSWSMESQSAFSALNGASPSAAGQGAFSPAVGQGGPAPEPPRKALAAVLAYRAVGAEADPAALCDYLAAHGVAVAYPVCTGQGVMCARVPEKSAAAVGDAAMPDTPAHSAVPLGWCADRYGILSPDPANSTLLSPGQLDAVLVPLTAFDEACRRTGQGGGFYDRYLPLCENAVAIGVAFEAQKTDRVVATERDAALDAVCTEQAWHQGPPRRNNAAGAAHNVQKNESEKHRMQNQNQNSETELVNGLFDFLDAGVSPFHAAAAAGALLEKAGFEKLAESAPWTLCPGKKYYTTRNGSAVIAFRLPEAPLCGWHVSASHSDAPTWRIKTHGGDNRYYAKAETEGYGGMILSTWLDRPLTLAGRVLVRTETGIESRLVAPDADLLCIPNVAIHFNREVNAGYKYDPQVDLQPMFGAAGQSLSGLLAAEAGVPEQALAADDLVLAVRQKAVRVGLSGEYFMSGRIDDLECAYTTLLGFLAARGAEPGRGDVWCMFDNEEVGSSSRQGACGSFLPDVLARIEEALGVSAERSVCARANSLLLSADNGHAIHPNHPEKSDPENPVTLGGGVVLKYNASQKYTTSGLTAAVFTEICRRAEVPVQVFANRADMPGGSTLGNLLGHQISIPMVDIGLAQLAMHSAVETAACADAVAMVRAVSAFYNTPLRQTSDGVFAIG